MANGARQQETATRIPTKEELESEYMRQKRNYFLPGQWQSEEEEGSSLVGLAGRGLAHGTLGIGEAVGTGLEWLGRRFDEEEDEEGLLTRVGRETSEYWGEKREKYGPPEELAGKNVWDNPELLKNASWWVYNVASTVPSFAASMVAGAGAGAYIKVAGKSLPFTEKAVERLARLGSMTAGGAAGGTLEGAATYKQVLEETGDEEEAARAGEMMALGSGALNALSVGKVLAKAGDSFKGRVIKHLGSGAWEGLTEGAEEPTEVFSKLTAKYLTGEELPEDIQKQFVESFKDGLTVMPIAGVTGLGGSVVLGGGEAAPKEAPRSELPQEIKSDLEAMDRDDLISLKKTGAVKAGSPIDQHIDRLITGKADAEAAPISPGEQHDLLNKETAVFPKEEAPAQPQGGLAAMAPKAAETIAEEAGPTTRSPRAHINLFTGKAREVSPREPVSPPAEEAPVLLETSETAQEAVQRPEPIPSPVPAPEMAPAPDLAPSRTDFEPEAPPAVEPEIPEAVSPRRLDIPALIAEVEPQAPQGAMARISKMREASGLSKEEFDQTLLDSQKRGEVWLHRHMDPGNMTEDEKALAVQGEADGKPAWYVGVTLRETPVQERSEEYAERIREDEGQVPERRPVEESRPEEGRPDLEREAPEEPGVPEEIEVTRESLPATSEEAAQDQPAKKEYQEIEVLGGRKKAVIDPRRLPTPNAVTQATEDGLNEITLRPTSSRATDTPIKEQVRSRKAIIDKLKKEGWEQLPGYKNVWRYKEAPAEAPKPPPPTTQEAEAVPKTPAEERPGYDDYQAQIDTLEDRLIEKYGQKVLSDIADYEVGKKTQNPITDEELREYQDLYRKRNEIGDQEATEFFSQVAKDTGLEKQEAEEALKRVNITPGEGEGGTGTYFTSESLRDWEKSVTSNLSKLYNHFARKGEKPYEATYAKFVWGGTADNPTLQGRVFDEDNQPAQWDKEALKKTEAVYNAVAKNRGSEPIDLSPIPKRQAKPTRKTIGPSSEEASPSRPAPAEAGKKEVKHERGAAKEKAGDTGISEAERLTPELQNALDGDAPASRQIARWGEDTLKGKKASDFTGKLVKEVNRIVKGLPKPAQDWINKRLDNNRGFVIPLKSLDNVPPEFHSAFRAAGAITVNRARINIVEELDQMLDAETLRHELVHLAWYDLNTLDRKGQVIEYNPVVEEAFQKAVADAEKIIRLAFSRDAKNLPAPLDSYAKDIKKEALRISRQAKQDKGANLTNTIELELMVGGGNLSVSAMAEHVGIEYPADVLTIAYYNALAKRYEGAYVNDVYGREELAAYFAGQDPAFFERLFDAASETAKTEPKVEETQTPAEKEGVTSREGTPEITSESSLADQKKELLRQIDEAKKQAPKEAKGETANIQIKNGVSFKVPFDAASLSKFRTLVEKRFPTKPHKPPKPIWEKEPSAPKPASQVGRLGPLLQLEGVTGWYSDSNLLIKGTPPKTAKFGDVSIPREHFDRLFEYETKPLELVYFASEGADLVGMAPEPVVSPEEGDTYAIFREKGTDELFAFSQLKVNRIRKEHPNADFHLTDDNWLVAKVDGEPVALLGDKPAPFLGIESHAMAKEAGLVRLSQAPTETPKGLPVNQVRLIANGLKKQWKNPANEITVVKDLSEIKDSDIRKALSPGMKVKAVFATKADTGARKIYLIAGNMESRQDVKASFLEEALGHDGLRQAFGDKLNGFLDSVYAEHSDDIAKVAKDYRLDTDTEGGRRHATDEWLAKGIASASLPRRVMDRIVRAIRAWARQVFPGLQVSVAEARDLARRAIEQGERFGGGAEDVRMAQEPTEDWEAGLTPAARQFIEKYKAISAPKDLSREALEPNKAKRIKGLKDDLSPSAEGNLFTETVEGMKGVFSRRGKNWIGTKEDLSVFDVYANLPSHSSEKIPAWGRVVTQAQQAQEIKEELRQQLIMDPETGQSTTAFWKKLQKASPETYNAVARTLVDNDIYENGYKVTEEEEGQWKVETKNPVNYISQHKTKAEAKKKANKRQKTSDTYIYEVREGDRTAEWYVVKRRRGETIGVFPSEEEAWAAARQHEVEKVRAEHGDLAADAVRVSRATSDKGFMLLTQQLRDLLNKKQAAGLPPTIEVITLKGGKATIDIKEALAMMGDRRGHYFPRIRKPGDYMVYWWEKGGSTSMKKFNTQMAADAYEAKLLRQDYQTKKKRSEALPEDVWDLFRKVVGVQEIVTEALNRVQSGDLTLEDFGLKYTEKERNGQRYATVSGPANKDMNRIFKDLGGRWYSIEEGEPKAWHFTDPPQDFKSRLIKKLSAEVDVVDQHMTSTFAEALAESLSSVIREHGHRAHMLRRKKDIVFGYETDPQIAYAQYASGVAAGQSKARMAMGLIRAGTGTDISWTQYQDLINSIQNNKDLTNYENFQEKYYEYEITKEEHDGLVEVANETEDKVEYRNYRNFVLQRRIDPAKQPNAFRAYKKLSETMLRNQEAAERVVGFFKGLAVFKYLAFRVFSAPLINLTALPTSATGAMSGYGNIPLNQSLRYLVKGIREYHKFYKGKTEGMDPNLLSLFTEMQRKGWDNPQFNREAFSVLQNQLGRGWNRLIEAGMYTFGKSETLNRAATISGAYMALKDRALKQGKTFNHKEAMALAKKISDRAHGIYGKSNKPMVIMGSGYPEQIGQAFYMYRTFAYTYLLTMRDLGFKLGPIKVGKGKTKPFLHMLAAPAILAGAGASAASPLLQAILKAVTDSDDPEEDFYQWLYDEIGAPAERLGRFGLFGLAGINLKGSLEIGLMDIPTEAVDFLGAPGSVVSDVYEGLEKITKGQAGKGIEQILPLGFAAPFKAHREATEGLTTRTNAPLFYGRDPVKLEGAETFLRVLAFNPARIASIREKQWHETKREMQYREDKRDIYAHIKKFYLLPPRERTKERWGEILAMITEYNTHIQHTGALQKGLASPITRATIKQSLRRALRPPKRERLRGE